MNLGVTLGRTLQMSHEVILPRNNHLAVKCLSIGSFIHPSFIYLFTSYHYATILSIFLWVTSTPFWRPRFYHYFEFYLGGLVSVWTKHYCNYQKENKILTMIPFTQTMGKMVRHVILQMR